MRRPMRWFYQTAYLKANYPGFNLWRHPWRLGAGNTDKLAVFRQECPAKINPYFAT
ncbi:MAG: hypothetical protein CM15mP46_1640 [Alphaproteobacteria bacterium]|nr:MAG: hypothetical protein CM15mP46_1640 [Alphaproteobacteria bacterium]